MIRILLPEWPLELKDITKRHFKVHRLIISMQENNFLKQVLFKKVHILRMW